MGRLLGVVLAGLTIAVARPSVAAPVPDVDTRDVPTPTRPDDGALEDAADAVDETLERSEPSRRGETRGAPAPRIERGPERPGSGDRTRVGPAAAGSPFELPPAERLDPYGPRPDGVPRLSLSQVTTYALENPAIKQAEQEIEAMEAQLRKVRFAWIPVIETTTTLAPGVNTRCHDVNLDDGTVDGFDFQYCFPGTDPDLDVNTVSGYFRQLKDAGVRIAFAADMIIPLTGFGKLKHLKNAAKAAVALEQLQKLQVQQETVLRVRQAWTTLLLARESKRILREANDIVVKARERVEKDLGGVGEDDWADDDADEVNLERDPTDLYRVELAGLEVEQMMRQALKIESLALSALWALAGKAAPQGFDVLDDELRRWEISGGLQDLKTYKEIAVRQRPEARMASAAVRARRAQERLARANFLPDLGLVLQFDVAHSTAADAEMDELYYQDRFNYDRITAALALRWKWDFHNKVFDLQAARATHRAAEYQEEAARLLLGRDVEQAYADLIEALHRTDTARRAQEASWKLVVDAEQDDMVGGGDAAQLLRDLEKWYRLRFEYLEAVQQYNDALARLSRAVGQSLVADP